jgi:hypothetical protein
VGKSKCNVDFSNGRYHYAPAREAAAEQIAFRMRIAEKA